MQNSAQFRTTLDSDCKYLRNGSALQKQKKQVFNYNSTLDKTW